MTSLSKHFMTTDTKAGYLSVLGLGDYCGLFGLVCLVWDCVPNGSQPTGLFKSSQPTGLIKSSQPIGLYSVVHYIESMVSFRAHPDSFLLSFLSLSIQILLQGVSELSVPHSSPGRQAAGQTAQ